MSALTVLADTSKGCNYPDIPSSQIKSIAIFPPVGISRVGDSTKECFLAPEVSGRTSVPDELQGKFRDADQKLRRMAVRFRVYAYDASGKLLGEINKKNGYLFTWKVDVANKKAANFEFQHSGRFDYPSSTALRNPKVQNDRDRDQRTQLIVAATGSIQYDNQDAVVLQGSFQGSARSPMPVQLAHLQVDDAGRLIFVPGTGDARSVADPDVPHQKITSEFDNADWIDEICDGQVNVQVKKKDGTTIPGLVTGLPARVLSAPTKFSWGVHQPTNLHDIMENIYYQAQHPLVPPPQKGQLDFWRDLWPALHAAASMAWANNSAFQGHGPFGNAHFDADSLFVLFKGSTQDPDLIARRRRFKDRVFSKLRPPLVENDIQQTAPQANVRFMPLLSGDIGDMTDAGTFPVTGDLQNDPRRFACLTNLQYDRFKTWAEDDGFYLTGPLPTPKDKLEDISVANQPKEVTRAILEWTIGDPLFPGIEMYWISKLKETYYINPSDKTLDPPFRIDSSVESGYLTRGLSLPWQCDFDLCEVHWWPAARPDDVVTRIGFEAIVQNSKEKKDFDSAVTGQVKWSRGLRETVAYSRSQTDWFGSDDMLRYWRYLGILREAKDAFIDKNKKKYTVYLEDERVKL